MAFWEQADIDALKAAVQSGVLEVEYQGPPRRKVIYQSQTQMRALLAEMRREVEGSVTHRKAVFSKGFRGIFSSRWRRNE